ncbi:IS1 family transposase, partial [Vibrio vulnificus]
AFGKRNTDALRSLLTLLKPFDISFFFTDDFSVYAKELSKEKHVVGKRFTQRIERTNLTLRSRLKRLVRRTIGFSRETANKSCNLGIERGFERLA